MTIEEFVAELSTYETTAKVTNLYKDGYLDNRPRDNLLRYLRIMREQNPAILLVGEAPGYKGCRLTGIPFTSEQILECSPFFANKDFPTSQNPERESTASIVWHKLDGTKFYPLLWNAFPFHPHGKGNVLSNRAPNQAELRIGRKFIEDLKSIFSIETNNVFAVGRKAQKCLGVSEKHYIRHPSHGGQTDFYRGIDRIRQQTGIQHIE